MSSDSNQENEESAESPGVFMKATIKSMKLKFPSVKNIVTSILAQWLKPESERHVILLDARPEEEFVVSHLEGAKRVDFQQKDWSAITKELQEKFKGKPNPTVVSYCSIGYRSSVVIEKLQEYYSKSGIRPAPEFYNLEGSIFQWANEHRPMVDSNGQRTKFAHPYSAVWGKLLDKSLRKSHP